MPVFPCIQMQAVEQPLVYLALKYSCVWPRGQNYLNVNNFFPENLKQLVSRV